MRKGSVDDVLAGAGMGGLGNEGMVLMGDCWVDEVAEETERVLMPFIVADSMCWYGRKKNERVRTRDDGYNDRVGFAGGEGEGEEERRRRSGARKGLWSEEKSVRGGGRERGRREERRLGLEVNKLS